MTIDKSLKVKGSGVQNRNVLTCAERIEKLISAEKFKEGDKVLGLPKVRVHKARAEEEEEGQGGRRGRSWQAGCRWRCALLRPRVSCCQAGLKK